MNLALTLRYLYPRAGENDFAVADHGDGQVIAHWGLPEPQPTAEQLADAWTAVQAAATARETMWQARVAMADAFHALPAQVRADHALDYTAVEAALIRGDVEAARVRVETMQISSAVPEAEREVLRAQFLSFFPPQ